MSVSDSWLRWIILLIICSNGISYGVCRHILVPIQDQLIDWYDINSIKYNLLMTLYAWPNVIFCICWGVLIDRIGVKKIIFTSWSINIIGLFVILYSCININYYLLCIGRFIVGIGNEGLNVSAKLYMIQFFKHSEYGIVFGVYSSFLALGSGVNTWITYRIYLWFNIKYAMAIPLIISPFTAIPLFILMCVYKSMKIKSSQTDNENVKLL
eukprot:385074_1